MYLGGPRPGLVNNKIRNSRHLQRSTPSVEVSVRTRNPRSDYPFTTETEQERGTEQEQRAARDVGQPGGTEREQESAR